MVLQKGGSVIQATWMPEPLKRGNQSEAGKSPHRVRILLKLNAFSDTRGGMDKVLPWANEIPISLSLTQSVPLKSKCYIGVNILNRSKR